MRKVLFLMPVFIVMMAIPGAYAQSSDDKQQQMASESDTLEFTVYGMDCPGCEGGLEKQVNKMKSVKDSKANWRKQLLQIVLKPGADLDPETLEKRVKKANLTLDKDAFKEEE